MEIIMCLLLISMTLYGVNFILNDYDIWNPGNLYFLFANISILSFLYLLPIFKIKISFEFVLLLLI